MSFINSKTIWHELPYPLDGTETTRGPTYSMTRAIGATHGKKGFIHRCHCLHCHYSPLAVEVTCHNDRPLQWPHQWACRRESPQCRHILQSTWRVHAATIQTGQDMPAGPASLTIWPDPLPGLQLCISIDFVSYNYYSISLHTFSSLLISYVLAQARPTMFCIH